MHTRLHRNTLNADRNETRPVIIDELSQHPCFQDSQEPTEESGPPAMAQSSQLPPPTWWLPGLRMTAAEPLTAPTAPAQAEPPDSPQEPAAPGNEPEPPVICRSERTNFGLLPARYHSE
ncbi:swi5-dependent recombination DNA repair protein 1 homolog [Thunnus maccoyii]|uniref:swi5-dependent recombination DNA repair protein 1 homolog n=1 Tax=Thunnus maccoyii TaxID=8240 RepID=UPI001C4CF26E|nr:swi5-dependent recombination DNA repair protein 1 homolog [Thunnus maccoyii]